MVNLGPCEAGLGSGLTLGLVATVFAGVLAETEHFELRPTVDIQARANTLPLAKAVDLKE